MAPGPRGGTRQRSKSAPTTSAATAVTVGRGPTLVNRSRASAAPPTPTLTGASRHQGAAGVAGGGGAVVVAGRHVGADHAAAAETGVERPLGAVPGDGHFPEVTGHLFPDQDEAAVGQLDHGVGPAEVGPRLGD